MTTNIDDLLPTVADWLEVIAQAEAARANMSMLALKHEEADKDALLDRFRQPSGVDAEDEFPSALHIGLHLYG